MDHARRARAIGVEPEHAGASADTLPERAAISTPRAGTKQALVIKLLSRPEGATVEQIAAATGWQHHAIRGANSGALKKKLGWTVATTRTTALRAARCARILDPGTSAPPAAG